MNLRNLLIPLIVLCWSAAGAGEPSLGPVIQSFGPTYDVVEPRVSAQTMLSVLHAHGFALLPRGANG